MSGYGEEYREREHQRFVQKWVPERGDLTDREVNYLARARCAEDELKKVKDALRALRSVIK